MDLVKKFVLNTGDFQIYFDNDKKTYVALNMETGEKTNVGVLGTFLQMGILKPLEEIEKKDVILQKLHELEEEINKLREAVDNLNHVDVKKEPEKPVETSEELQVKEEVTNEEPKSEIVEQIMEKTLEKLSKEREESQEETDEELKNWLEI
jgi:hypothetical protein